MRAMMKGLSHLSVGNRLFLGFGLSCLLTLVVGLSGGRAVGLMSESHTRTRALAELQAEVLRLQVAQRDFAQVRSGEAARAVRQLIAQLASHLGDRKGQAGILAIEQAHSAYDEEFERFDRLQTQGQEARGSMQSQADEVRRTFEVVEQDFFDAAEGLDNDNEATTGLGRTEAISQANSVAELMRMLLGVRTLEFAYDLTPSQENVDAWRTASAALTATLDSLHQRVDGAHQAALQEAQGAFQQYIQAFGGFREGSESSVASQVRMIEQANRMQAAVVGLYEAESRALEQDGRRFQIAVAVTALLALVLGAAAAWGIRHLTLEPLRDTLHLVARVADGDLGDEALVARRDEFGVLQQTMAGMTANLRGLVGYIDAGVRRLALATSELTDLSGSSLDESQRQRAEAEQTSCAMQQVTASTRSVAQDSAEASLAAQQANGMARQGEALMQRMIDQVHQLSGGMRQTAGSISQLERESRTSVEMLGVIKALAEQTNLLALNAAIEAARAGEQGRGFAVVADGVRGLAGRTRGSASEIETTIQSWLEVTSRVVKEMSAGLALSDTCVELAEGVGQLLEQIIGEVSAIEARISQIATATEQQTQVAMQVNESAFRVQEMAQVTVDNTLQINSATQELAELGGDLQRLARQFRNVG